MKDWFESLELRERWFVAVGAGVVSIALLYGLLWSPLTAKHAALKSEVELWQSALAELRPLAALVTASDSSGAARVIGVQQSPIIVVDQTLRSRGLDRYRQRSQPSGSNGIRVEFENVAFDDLVLWLGDLSSQYGMNVQSGNFGKTSQAGAGRINANVTLERAL